MSLDSKDPKPYKTKNVWASFHYAIEGFLLCVKEERNMRIHLSVALLVSAMGLYLQISSVEWAILLLTIGWVVTLEMVNSAIERVVDLYTLHYHPLAKAAKDIAAGAVSISSCIAVIVGIIIFFPKWF